MSLIGHWESITARRRLSVRELSPPCDTAANRRPCSASSAIAPRPRSAASSTASSLARPDLTDAQRAAIAQAMSGFRNQLLHHPRSTLRAAADAGTPPIPTPCSTPPAASSAWPTPRPPTRSTRAGPGTVAWRNHSFDDRSSYPEFARTDEMLAPTLAPARRRGMILILVLAIARPDGPDRGHVRNPRRPGQDQCAELRPVGPHAPGPTSSWTSPSSN